MPSSKINPQPEAANSSNDENTTSNLLDMSGEALYQLAVAARKDKRDAEALENFKKAWQRYCHPSALIGLWELTLTNNPLANRQYKALITPEIINQQHLRASSGQAEELYTLGLCYQFGLGIDKNYYLAITLYERAIELGSPLAMVNRAIMHQQGLGGEVNNLEAIRLYEQAIELGNACAMTNRAVMHQQGLGGAPNYTQATQLLERAIKLGNAAAMNNRAVMHQHGQGGDVNNSLAISLFERAIELSYAGAMNNRATMHLQGLGGEPNYAQAIYLYERAIAKGDDVAMYYRSLMHRQGTGNTPEVAASLLSLLWADLLAGKFFTKETLILLYKHCKNNILASLVDEESPFYLCVDNLSRFADKHHPLAIILGAKDERPSPQHQKLLEHIETIKIDIQHADLAIKVFSEEANITALSEPSALISAYLKGSGLFAKGQPQPVASPERSRHCTIL